MPGDPKKCRTHAANCRRWARRATGETARQAFLDLADTWDRLATELESAARFIEALLSAARVRESALPETDAPAG